MVTFFEYKCFKMLFSYLITQSLISPSSGQFCDDIKCSNIIDYVCGLVKSRDGNEIIMKYQNICYMRKIQCELNKLAVIQEMPDHYCNIDKLSTDYDYDQSLELSETNLGGRRVTDYSIVGAHQVCNHTCPTYCTDAYEPACAQIWKRNARTFSYRPMINHCHIDLFSCSTRLNVTIQPLATCYHNASPLLFMMQMAALKSLKLLNDKPLRHRRANIENLSNVLLDLVGNIFKG